MHGTHSRGPYAWPMHGVRPVVAQVNLPQSSDFYTIVEQSADQKFWSQLLCIVSDQNPDVGYQYPGACGEACRAASGATRGRQATRRTHPPSPSCVLTARAEPAYCRGGHACSPPPLARGLGASAAGKADCPGRRMCVLWAPLLGLQPWDIVAAHLGGGIMGGMAIHRPIHHCRVLYALWCCVNLVLPMVSPNKLMSKQKSFLQMQVTHKLSIFLQAAESRAEVPHVLSLASRWQGWLEEVEQNMAFHGTPPRTCMALAAHRIGRI